MPRGVYGSCYLGNRVRGRALVSMMICFRTPTPRLDLLVGACQQLQSKLHAVAFRGLEVANCSVPCPFDVKRAIVDSLLVPRLVALCRAFRDDSGGISSAQRSDVSADAVYDWAERAMLVIGNLCMNDRCATR